MTPQWITPSVAVYTSGRPEATIRDWMRRGLLPVACDVRSRQLVINAAHVAELATTIHSRRNARKRTARSLDRITAVLHNGTRRNNVMPKTEDDPALRQQPGSWPTV